VRGSSGHAALLRKKRTSAAVFLWKKRNISDREKKGQSYLYLSARDGGKDDGKPSRT